MIRSDAPRQSGGGKCEKRGRSVGTLPNAETWGNAHLQTMIENRVRVRLCAMLQGRGEVRWNKDVESWEKCIEKSPLAMGKWGFGDEELRCMDLTQIDEFLSVANIELAADGLRHFATVEIVDRGGIGVALYVLYGRDEEIAE